MLNGYETTYGVKYGIIIAGFKAFRNADESARSSIIPNIKAQINKIESIRDDGKKAAAYKRIIGVDTINEEDNDRSLTIAETGAQLFNAFKLLEAKNPEAKLLLHAGENVNPLKKANVATAIMLGASRMGHGFGIAKSLSNIIFGLENNVGLEICPISNKLLGYHRDLKDHPAPLLQKVFGYPISISPDDPSIYGYQGVTWDWYNCYV